MQIFFQNSHARNKEVSIKSIDKEGPACSDKTTAEIITASSGRGKGRNYFEIIYDDFLVESDYPNTKSGKGTWCQLAIHLKLPKRTKLIATRLHSQIAGFLQLSGKGRAHIKTEIGINSDYDMDLSLNKTLKPNYEGFDNFVINDSSKVKNPNPRCGKATLYIKTRIGLSRLQEIEDDFALFQIDESTGYFRQSLDVELQGCRR